MLLVGAGLVVTVPDPVPSQPSVYVTVYVVVVDGETVMFCVVAPPGDQR